MEVSCEVSPEKNVTIFSVLQTDFRYDQIFTSLCYGQKNSRGDIIIISIYILQYSNNQSNVFSFFGHKSHLKW